MPVERGAGRDETHVHLAQLVPCNCFRKRTSRWLSCFFSPTTPVFFGSPPNSYSVYVHHKLLLRHRQGHADRELGSRHIGRHPRSIGLGLDALNRVLQIHPRALRVPRVQILGTEVPAISTLRCLVSALSASPGAEC